MPGPPPKDPEQRRRRNRPPEVDVLPAAGYSGPRPELPVHWRSTSFDGRPVRVRYLASTRAWFDVWASSPQASRFASTDWQRLLMLAPLVDQYHRSPSQGLAGELRLQEERLGATMLDRQRLRVRIEDVEGAGVASASAPAASASSARRARLKAV